MKLVITITICFLSFLNISYCQGWIKRKNVPDGSPIIRQISTGASALGKGYLTGGRMTVHYEYNPATQSWKKVTPLPGDSRHSAVSATINNKIYYGLGLCSFYPNPNYSGHKALYEYDPVTDTWTQKASFPGAARWVETYFTAGDKLYVTAGDGPTGGAHLPRDTWEYDPANDAWTLRDSFPETRTGAAAFGLNGRGYVVGGNHNGYPDSTLWEYNPAIDTWTKKATLPFGDIAGVAFTIGTYGYLLTSNQLSDSSFWKYDPANNAWTRLPDFPGLSRYWSTSFSIGNSGFVMTGEHVPPPGQSGPIKALIDLWEYNPDCLANMINDLSIDSMKELYCADSIFIDTIKAYTVAYNNTVYEWMSSTDGVNYSTAANSNTPQLANLGLTQTTYFKRIVTQNAKCFDTSMPLKINIEHFQYPVIDTLTNTTACQGDTIMLQCINPYTKQWYAGGNSLSDTGDTIKIWYSSDITVIATHDWCSFSSDTIKTTIRQLPPKPGIKFTPAQDGYICKTLSPYYQWYKGDGTILTGETDSIFYPKDTGYYYVLVTDSNGCSSQSVTTFYKFPAGVSYLNNEGFVQIAPNPVKDVLNINNVPGKTIYKLYNILGELIAEDVLMQTSNTIHLNSLQPGIYILELQYDNLCNRYRILKE